MDGPSVVLIQRFQRHICAHRAAQLVTFPESNGFTLGLLGHS